MPRARWAVPARRPAAVARPDPRPHRLVRAPARRARRRRPARYGGDGGGRRGGRRRRGRRRHRVATATGPASSARCRWSTGCPAPSATTRSRSTTSSAGRATVGGRVVVLDDLGDWRGLGTALHLAEAGHDVTIVTSAAVVGGGLFHSAADVPLRRRFAAAGGDDAARHGRPRLGRARRRPSDRRSPGATDPLPADTLVIAETPVAETALADGADAPRASRSRRSATASRRGGPAWPSTRDASSPCGSEAARTMDVDDGDPGDSTTPTPARRGRSARQAARLARAMETLPYLTRKLPPVEVVSTDGLEAIEHNADTLLQEVGIEVVNFPEAVEIFRSAGADVQGTRVRFERGMCRADRPGDRAARASPRRARNAARSVVIGDPHMVLVPTYGSPFIHNLDDGRRYATIEDFRNFVKLTYTSTTLHHGGGTLCEPTDLPVNKRHFEMVYSHIRYSDRAFMGSVTHPSRAQDSVDMAQDRLRRRDARARARDHGPGQRQLADVVGLQHARLGQGLRREQPDHADHAVHPRRGDGAGDGRRRCDPDPRRGTGRHGLLPDRAAGRAGHLRLVRVVDVDADRARRRSARRSRSSCCSCSPPWRAGSASRSGAAATSRPPRSPTTRPPTRARSASWPRCRPA